MQWDIDALEALMCQNIKQNVVNLSNKIYELMDAIESEITEFTWKFRGGTYFERRTVGKQIGQSGFCIYFTTTTGTYDVMVWWEDANSFNPEETKIRNIALGAPNGDVLVMISATEGISSWHD